MHRSIQKSASFGKEGKGSMQMVHFAQRMQETGFKSAKVGQGREVSDGLEYSDNHRVCEEGSDALEGMMH